MIYKVNSLKPRKSPTQARSTATVDILHEATIQVLLKEGIARCNTTRIAERAGISVGSIYQYYPNRDSLLSAVLEKHLDTVAQRIEKICHEFQGMELAKMVTGLVHEILIAKLNDSQKSRALYTIAAERGGLELSKKMTDRMINAIANLLASASDIHFDESIVVAEIILGAIMGSIRRVLENHVTERVEVNLEHHLKIMMIAYLKTVGTYK